MNILRRLLERLQGWTGVGQSSTSDYSTFFRLSQADQLTIRQLFHVNQTQLASGNVQGLLTISTAEERRIVEEIRAETLQENMDNISRTAAYLCFYQKHPSIHWAFLAHMVSRNGGWGMTDLHGEPIGKLIKPQMQNPLFDFLERCNYLIFSDAYPQLLLWERSLQMKKPLFHLLARFGVSSAMVPMWNWFWEQEKDNPAESGRLNKHRCALTHALIVNEQNFIESRVVQNDQYRESVFHTLEFQSQKWLDLTLVLFPYHQGGMESVKLSGVIVHDFADLKSRIVTGKQLYEILFGNRQVRQGCHRFAFHIPHTGSRSDYHPYLFQPVPYSALSSDQRVQRTYRSGCTLSPESPLLASPFLREVRPAVRHRPIEPGDWCKDPDHLLQFLQSAEAEREAIRRAKENHDITESYCKGLKTMEMAEQVESAFR